jgi:hypothetical protein
VHCRSLKKNTAKLLALFAPENLSMMRGKLMGPKATVSRRNAVAQPLGKNLRIGMGYEQIPSELLSPKHHQSSLKAEVARHFLMCKLACSESPAG